MRLSQKEIDSLIEINNTDSKRPQKMFNLSNQQLRVLPSLPESSPISSLQNLNISYNFIKKLPSLPNLQYLDISFNFLTEITNKTVNAPKLQYLDATANRLQIIDIDDVNYPEMDMLLLKNNKIEFMMNCPSKTRMIYLDHNKLNDILFNSQNINVLSATNNQIEHISGKFPHLVFLDLEDNKIKSIQQLNKILQNGKLLLSINFINNPISSHIQFKTSILSSCPKIVKINENMINPHIREGFRLVKNEQKLEEMLEQIQNKHKNKVTDQIKVKQKMIKQLKLQQKQIETNFKKYLDEQRNNMKDLSRHAQQILGKQKLGIKQQNDQFENCSAKKGYLQANPTQKSSEDHILQQKMKYQQFIKNKQHKQQQSQKEQQQQIVNIKRNQQYKKSIISLQKKKHSSSSSQQQNSNIDNDDGLLSKNMIRSIFNIGINHQQKPPSRSSRSKKSLNSPRLNNPSADKKKDRTSIISNTSLGNAANRKIRFDENQAIEEKQQVEQPEEQDKILDPKCYRFLQKYYILKQQEQNQAS